VPAPGRTRRLAVNESHADHDVVQWLSPVTDEE
jgi:hypothetical protein